MFVHNYIYRLKCILRNKEMMFWSAIFPIILAVFFNMALTRVHDSERFNEIRLAVVDTSEEFKNNLPFQEALKSVSGKPDFEGSISGKSNLDTDNIEDKNLFNIVYTTTEESERMLQKKEIEGYIYFDKGPKLVVKDSGLNQTIIKSFIEDFEATSSTVKAILKENPNAIRQGFLDKIMERNDFLIETPMGKTSPDTYVNFFYTLMAMASLYGGFIGLNEVVAIQANLSAQGARLSIAPTHKLKVFFIALLAAFTVHFTNILILMIFVNKVLGVSFGKDLGYIILTCAIGSLTGITFGTFLTATIRGDEKLKIGVLLGLTMTMSFLSGMMLDTIKYLIMTKTPILGYLNPASLLTDCFYALYYYDNYNVFYRNIFLLSGFIVIFGLSTYFVLRRQKYASV